MPKKRKGKWNLQRSWHSFKASVLKLFHVKGPFLAPLMHLAPAVDIAAIKSLFVFFCYFLLMLDPQKQPSCGRVSWSGDRDQVSGRCNHFGLPILPTVRGILARWEADFAGKEEFRYGKYWNPIEHPFIWVIHRDTVVIRWAYFLLVPVVLFLTEELGFCFLLSRHGCVTLELIPSAVHTSCDSLCGVYAVWDISPSHQIWIWMWKIQNSGEFGSGGDLVQAHLYLVHS